jgi:hypothetical protein
MKDSRLTTAFLYCVGMLIVPQMAAAAAGQDRVYPGVLCQLRGDALRGEGAFVQSYKQGRNREVTKPLPMWQYLDVSEFGAISNKSEMNNMPVVCPIESGAISDSDGISVSVKFSTALQSDQQNDLADEFHCALTNINGQATAAVRSVRSTLGDLREAAPGEVNTLTLSLPNSDAETLSADSGAGGYVLACWLPKARQEAKGDHKIESTLIQYAVREID